MNGRGNGLADQAPDPNQTILVAGGAGYIGCVLIPRLVERGYKIRLLDRMYFGEQGLEGVRVSAAQISHIAHGWSHST